MRDFVWKKKKNHKKLILHNSSAILNRIHMVCAFIIYRDMKMSTAERSREKNLRFLSLHADLYALKWV